MMNANLTTAQANTQAQEIEVTMNKIARKPVTDEDGRFNINYMNEIRACNSQIHEATIKIETINTESAVLLKNILKDYENYLGGKTYWFDSDKEKYFEKIKTYNAMIDKRKAQEEIIKEAKKKLAEYDY